MRIGEYRSPAISVVAGQYTREDLRRFGGALTIWLERAAPFAVPRVFADAEALRHTEDGASLANQWMENKAGRICHSVIGLASVVPASAHEKMARMNVEKAVGAKGGIFLDRHGALASLAEQVFTLGDPAFDPVFREALFCNLAVRIL